MVWLKNNSVLNIIPGGAGFLDVEYEPLAVINNTAGATYTSYTCTSISFPAGNCTTGIQEGNSFNKNFLLHPNPASSKIFISLENADFITSEVELINYLGQMVLKSSFKNEIDISSLPGGIYTLQLISKNQIAQKRLIITK